MKWIHLFRNSYFYFIDSMLLNSAIYKRIARRGVREFLTQKDSLTSIFFRIKDSEVNWLSTQVTCCKFSISYVSPI